jgi:predicted transposase/invertase (TIGR01784 family)
MSKDLSTQESEILSFSDIPIEHFQDRGARWLFEDKEYVRDLVEILSSELAACIDFSRISQINRSFIPDTLREQESDMVFTAPFQTGSGTDELLIYILIEHQSTVDPIMGFRVLFYMMQIWDFQRREWVSDKVPKSQWRFRPIIPIVYYTGENRWSNPLTLDAIMDMPDALARFVPKFDTLFLSVNETDAADLKETDLPLGWLITILQQKNADIETISTALFEAMPHVKHLRKAVIYLVLFILHQRPAVEHRDLIQIVEQQAHDMEVENMTQSIIEISKEEGRTQAKRESIIKLIQSRFDILPDAVATEIDSIQSFDRLNVIFDKALTAETLDEIGLQDNNS